MLNLPVTFDENISIACTKTIRANKEFRTRTVKALAKKYEREIKAETPKSEAEKYAALQTYYGRSEHAADAWDIDYEQGAGGLTGFDITNPYKHIDYLEYGTPAHMIFPKDEGGTMAWKEEEKTVFAKDALHLGIKAMGFVRKAQKRLALEVSRVARAFERKVERNW